MTKTQFWKMLIVNLGECPDCPLSREGLCEKYSKNTGDDKISPCFSAEMCRKAYEEMEDE